MSFLGWRRSGIALVLTIILGACATVPPSTDKVEQEQTQWVVSTSPGLDALLLIGVISGDVLQAPYYAETIGFLREKMPPESVAALDRIDQNLRVEKKRLTGPTLVNFFSAGPTDTLDDVLRSARDPETYLKPGLMAEADWSERNYAAALQIMPDIALALEGLKEVGLEEFYAKDTLPRLNEAIAAIEPAVSGYDLIPYHELYLGRDLDPEIELIVVRFAHPYGIRIKGQRFLAVYHLDPDTHLHVAAHEIFHPPFDRQDKELLEKLKPLEEDPWIISIVENRNPAFGYNSFMGLIDEDSTQALDQLLAEHFDFAAEPGPRWSSRDDGMHLLAAALYHAMKEDGFAQTGGVYADWFKSALDRGLLTPEEVRRRAAEVAGQEAVQKWYDIAEEKAAAAR
ncbi:hypothetical protein [Parvularcula marina]|uniref:hypothetical protein n=1 Tax=Parvularcula marina TaxID=2292771 RepID=UPI003517A92E